MRWKGHRKSDNVEDRRGMSGGKVLAGGGIGAIILVVVTMFFPDLQKFLPFIEPLVNAGGTGQTEQTVEKRSDEMDEFVQIILASTEQEWGEVFPEQLSKQYQPATLVMFTNSVQSACGGASSAMGPFYCPADHRVYIDLDFCDELRNRFKAPGEFAVAYVVAHEVGHHIQNLLGISAQVQSQRGRLSEAEYNKLSVKLELQADFLAGVWAYYSNKRNAWLDTSDIESALRAANAIGDDKLQKEAQGYAVPESFTHGTSEQRMYWFKKGFTTGDLNQGNFNAIK